MLFFLNILDGQVIEMLTWHFRVHVLSHWQHYGVRLSVKLYKIVLFHDKPEKVACRRRSLNSCWGISREKFDSPLPPPFPSAELSYPCARARRKPLSGCLASVKIKSLWLGHLRILKENCMNLAFKRFHCLCWF